MPSYSATEFASGLKFPAGLAFDNSGNLFCAYHNNDNAIPKISKITPDGTVSTFASVLNSPKGLAFDNSGNLYVANKDDNTISKITPEGSVSTFVSSGLAGPAGLAFDNNGNLYCTNWNGSNIVKITPDGSTVSTFASGLNRPWGLAFDNNGNLYVSTYSDGTISKITPDGSTVSTFASGLNTPQSLAFDKNGNLYTGTSDHKLFVISSSGVKQELTITDSALYDVGGLAFDNNGNLYAANHDDHNIIKIALGVSSEILVISSSSSSSTQIICFPVNTPVTTDQGFVPIQELENGSYTINGNKVLGVVSSKSQSSIDMVLFKKNALGNNIPSQDTLMTRNHKVYYNNIPKEAISFTTTAFKVNKSQLKCLPSNPKPKVIQYTEEVYNVMLEAGHKMKVNNMIVETLDPSNKLYNVKRC